MVLSWVTQPGLRDLAPLLWQGKAVLPPSGSCLREGLCLQNLCLRELCTGYLITTSQLDTEISSFFPF